MEKEDKGSILDKGKLPVEKQKDSAVGKRTTIAQYIADNEFSKVRTYHSLTM